VPFSVDVMPEHADSMTSATIPRPVRIARMKISLVRLTVPPDASSHAGFVPTRFSEISQSVNEACRIVADSRFVTGRRRGSGRSG
jgi:hypothetical protein